MKSAFLARAALATALFAVPSLASAATTYGFASGYGSSVFQYGSGINGTANFTAFPSVYAGGCAGQANLACMTVSGNGLGVEDLLAVGVDTGATPVNAYTVTIPTNTLFMHPGAGLASDSIVRFIAPTTSTYTLNGMVSRLDNTNNGNGVLYSLFVNGAPVLTGTGSLLPGAGPFAVTYTGALKAGDVLSFGVNNNGDVFYDSTGLSGSISAVPEPATWGLMILGIGMVGLGLRRRSRPAIA